MGKQRLKRKNERNSIQDQSVENVEFESDRDIIDEINLIDKSFQKRNFSKRG